MRDLNSLNPNVARPDNLASVAAILPLIISSCSLLFIADAAPDVSAQENYLLLFCFFIVVASFLLIAIPKLLRWGWQAKYFGLALIYVGSASFIGLIPLLCLIFYGSLPPLGKIILSTVNLIALIWWCSRFFSVYEIIKTDLNLWNTIYFEDASVVYYQQKGDKWVLEKKLKFSQVPSSLFFIMPLLFSFCLLPFMEEVVHYTGLPFTYLFLSISSIPVSMMSLGFATRAFIVFYYYPWQIKRDKGKDVYVDMSTNPFPHRKK